MTNYKQRALKSSGFRRKATSFHSHPPLKKKSSQKILQRDEEKSKIHSSIV